MFVTTKGSKLTEYVNKINNNVFNGVQIVKPYLDTRSGDTASITGKIEGGETAILAAMKSAFGNQVTIEKLSGSAARRISGTYDSYAINIASNDGFYFRSIVTSTRSLSKKDLTPVKLNLHDKDINVRNIDDLVLSQLNIQSIPTNIRQACCALLASIKKSTNSNANKFDISVDQSVIDCINSISTTDLKIIGTNFGEILVAKWCLYNKLGATKIRFPKEESNPLEDFKVYFQDGTELNISSKFEGGANASISSFLNEKTELPNGTAQEKQALEVLKAISTGNIINGLLLAEQILNTEEYKAIKLLCKVRSGNVTLNDISHLVSEVLTAAKITSKSTNITPNQIAIYKQLMKPFYDSVNNLGFPRNESFAAISRLADDKKFHPILYSFSSALAKRFNESKIYTSVLNKVARSIKAEQLYLSFESSSRKIVIHKKTFSDSSFTFAPGAIAYKADNTRMKISMTK